MTFTVPRMLVDQVDGENHVIGQVERKSVFALRANFRVVHVIVRNEKGSVLLQKIQQGLRHPGQWGSSAAGYLQAGETYKHAASRKLSSELGLRRVPLVSHGTTRMLDQKCRKFIGVYSVEHDGPVKLVPSQVAGIEFLSLEEIRDEAAAGRRTFTPTFLHVMNYLERNAFAGLG